MQSLTVIQSVKVLSVRGSEITETLCGRARSTGAPPGLWGDSTGDPWSSEGGVGRVGSEAGLPGAML